MKVEIDVNGTLTVWPETDVERYALKKWSEDNPDCAALSVFTETQEEYMESLLEEPF